MPIAFIGSNRILQKICERRICFSDSRFRLQADNAGIASGVDVERQLLTGARVGNEGNKPPHQLSISVVLVSEFNPKLNVANDRLEIEEVDRAVNLYIAV